MNKLRMLSILILLGAVLNEFPLGTPANLSKFRGWHSVDRPQWAPRREETRKKTPVSQGRCEQERSSILTIYLIEQTCSKMLRPLWNCH